MTTQAFEPSKTNGFHPSITKGAIAMSTDDFKPKKAPASPAQDEMEADERNAQLERAEAWRIEMVEHFENSGNSDESQERIQWLRGLEGDDLTRVHRFYLAAKGHAIMDAAENQSPATDEESHSPQQDPHAAWHAVMRDSREQAQELFRRFGELEKTNPAHKDEVFSMDQKIQALVVAAREYKWPCPITSRFRAHNQ